MDISDYLPNVFGYAPSGVEGLLGADQTQALNKQANVSGLLGAAMALATGMSRGGDRRSAAQNILGALGAGVGTAQGQYSGAVDNYAQQQQLQEHQQKLAQAAQTQAAINQLLQDPKIANDPAAVAFIRANPGEAIKLYAERNAFDSKVSALKQRQQPTPATASPVPAQGDLPAVEVTGNGEIANLEEQIQDSLIRAQVARSMNRPQDAKHFTDQAEALKKRQSNLSIQEFDFGGLKQSLPKQFHVEVDLLQKAAASGDLTGAELMRGVQSISSGMRDYAKSMKLEGNDRAFAMYRFGTDDMTQLPPQALAEVLRYRDLPDAEKQARLVREGMDTKFTTGLQPPIPAGRASMLPPAGAPQPTVAPQPAMANQPPPAVQAAPQPPVVQAVQRPSVTPVASTNTQPKPAQQSNVIPLVMKPDAEVPLKKKQELIAQKPSTIELGKYTVKNIAAARAAALELKNNPAYIDALTAENPASGAAVTVARKMPGTDAFTASRLLDNLGTRGFITEIQSMRQASPTGGAVGNVAVAEMTALSNVQAQLAPGMKKAEFLRQLDKYIKNADRALSTIKTEYGRTYGYQGEFDDLINGITPMDQGLPPGVTVKRKTQP